MTVQHRIHAGMTRRGALGAASALALAGRARAQAAPPFKIGVMSDQSGIMLDYSGFGTIASITMAVEDFGGNVLGRPDRGAARRPPEQARRGRRHRPRLV